MHVYYIFQTQAPLAMLHHTWSVSLIIIIIYIIMYIAIECILRLRAKSNSSLCSRACTYVNVNYLLFFYYIHNQLCDTK